MLDQRLAEREPGVEEDGKDARVHTALRDGLGDHSRGQFRLVPGCAAWAFTMTGFPAARADAVSPPATEKASGKLLAPKTATGPTGQSMDRRSGRGGLRSGSAVSMRAFCHEPSSSTEANRRNCPEVRTTSPWSRASGRAVSSMARATSVADSASRPAAIARSRVARSFAEDFPNEVKASTAA